MGLSWKCRISNCFKLDQSLGKFAIELCDKSMIRRFFGSWEKVTSRSWLLLMLKFLSFGKYGNWDGRAGMVFLDKSKEFRFFRYFNFKSTLTNEASFMFKRTIVDSCFGMSFLMNSYETHEVSKCSSWIWQVHVSGHVMSTIEAPQAKCNTVVAITISFILLVVL